MTRESDLANFALNISIAQVVRELGNRGLSPSGDPEVLRARLTQAIFQEAGLEPIPVRMVGGVSSLGAGASSDLPDTVPITTSVHDTMITIPDEREQPSLGARPKVPIEGGDHCSRSRSRGPSAGSQSLHRRGNESRGGKNSEVNAGGVVSTKFPYRTRALSLGPQREVNFSPPPYDRAAPRATSSFIQNPRHVSFSDETNFNSRHVGNSRLPTKTLRTSASKFDFEHFGGIPSPINFGSMNPGHQFANSFLHFPNQQFYNRNLESEDSPLSEDFEPVNENNFQNRNFTVNN